MAFAQASKSYLSWLQSQLDYCNGSPYINLDLMINPQFEINSFKISTNIDQQQVFHNAADDQVAYLRAMKEIQKSPSDYIGEYVILLKQEMALLQSQASTVSKAVTDQQSTASQQTKAFNTSFAPDVMADLAKYNPMRIFS